MNNNNWKNDTYGSLMCGKCSTEQSVKVTKHGEFKYLHQLKGRLFTCDHCGFEQQVDRSYLFDVVEN